MFWLRRGFHRAMVKTMTAAAKIPHFYFVEEINCDALVDLKAFFQKHSDPDVKHTSLPILIKSLSMALKKYPLLNSRFSEESNEVTLRGISLGFCLFTINMYFYLLGTWFIQQPIRLLFMLLYLMFLVPTPHFNFLFCHLSSNKMVRICVCMPVLPRSPMI